MTRCQQIPVSNITLFGTTYDENDFPQFVPVSSFGTITENETESFKMMSKYVGFDMSDSEANRLKENVRKDKSGNIFYTPMFGELGECIFQIERYIEFRSSKEKMGL